MSNPGFIFAPGQDFPNQDAPAERRSEAALQSTCGVLRNAALLDSDRPLGVLPDWAIPLLGIETTTRQVSLSAQVEHASVEKRRTRASQADADFIALHHVEALNNITAVEPYKPNRWRLICNVPSQNRGLALGLKLVPKDQARTHRDEFWIETVFPQSAPTVKD